jgi:hypothetical protein
MLSEKAEVGTERLLTGATVLARTVAESGIHDHGIADRESAHVIAHGVDHARRVGAQDPWGNDRDTGEAADHEQIEMVERGRADADAHVIGANQFRQREIAA